jgi:ribonuclease Z
MTTEVILTGTGVPHPRPGTAGAGALVRNGDLALQFDAGRSTVMRLMDAGTPPHALTALFLTHVHSDHLVGLPDVAMTRWIQQQLVPSGPLVIVVAEGVAARCVRRMLEPFDDDLALRVHHVGATPIEVDLRTFDVPAAPAVVWTSDDGSVRVRGGPPRGRLRRPHHRRHGPHDGRGVSRSARDAGPAKASARPCGTR